MIHAEVHRGPTDEIEEIKFSVTKSSLARFTEVINAGLNCKDQAHPELKELGDMLTHGKILQDYYSQQGIVREQDC